MLQYSSSQRLEWAASFIDKHIRYSSAWKTRLLLQLKQPLHWYLKTDSFIELELWGLTSECTIKDGLERRSFCGDKYVAFSFFLSNFPEINCDILLSFRDDQREVQQSCFASFRRLIVKAFGFNHPTFHPPPLYYRLIIHF
ncbi:hypothetical protein ATANTOWER_014237 [Ataeniobius toweri]|uniref:Maturase K n=1 Tax=Ataeniobius toweri TaxID=208326 RepID=A0ABU7AAG0_9TELE|nr:hypothetical protein [Ataeniobius toweri]